MYRITTIAFTVLILAGCGEPTSTDTDTPADAGNPAKALRLRLLNAKPGDVIEIPAGRIDFERGLSLNVDGVTIRGAGMDQTILSFKEQVAGAEGLLVSANDFTIEDLAIEDTKGDALKINEGKNIIIRRVRTEWTNGPDERNGAYGIYPVQTENTLIEESVAIGASDAGLYVGQSRNVVIRNNRAEFNVAGIEIENTIGADVYGNVATNNTGGILVFNLPDLAQRGERTRVFNNRVYDNNTDNFAPEGNIVGTVPAGSGIMISSNDLVEIFDNELANNKTAHILVTSYLSAGQGDSREILDTFDPYPETIFIHNNRFEGGGEAPDREQLLMVRDAIYGPEGRLPEVVWDGWVNPENTVDGQLKPEYALCIDNGEIGFINIDNGNGNANVSTDMTPHACTHERLAAVQLPASFSNGE
jgi:parallel beta-helix repeat protein